MSTVYDSEDAAGFNYLREVVSERPARKIHSELYPDSGYDAVWRLSNSGFVVRLDGNYLFLDPIFTSPLPAYKAIREESIVAERLITYRTELKHYRRWENLFKETHQLPLLPEDVKKADHLLLTHEHYDHFDPVGLKKFATLAPKIVAPRACHKDLKEITRISHESITEAEYGLTLEYESFCVQVRLRE